MRDLYTVGALLATAARSCDIIVTTVYVTGGLVAGNRRLDPPVAGKLTEQSKDACFGHRQEGSAERFCRLQGPLRPRGQGLIWLPETRGLQNIVGARASHLSALSSFCAG
jgi:hypothetical protein